MISMRTVHLLTISSYTLAALAVVLFSLAVPAGLPAGLTGAGAVITALAAQFIRRAVPNAIAARLLRAINRLADLSPEGRERAIILVRERLRRHGTLRQAGRFFTKLDKQLQANAA